MGGYVYSNVEQPLERMKLLEEALDLGTRNVLNRAGLGAGMTCLDVGTGAGSVLRMMSEAVGARGRVVGIDIDAQHARESQLSGVEIIEGDVLTLQRPAEFDLIHERLVLIHIPDKIAFVRHLASLLRPGGRLVIEEVDYRSRQWLRGPHPDAAERVFKGHEAIFRSRGISGEDMGLYVDAVTAADDLELDWMGVDARLELGPGPAGQVIAQSFGRIWNEHLATGEVEPGDLEKLRERIADSAALSIYGSMFSLIARRRE